MYLTITLGNRQSSMEHFDERTALAENGIEYNSTVYEFYRTYVHSGIAATDALKLAIQTAENSIKNAPLELREVMRTALYKVKGVLT